MMKQTTIIRWFLSLILLLLVSCDSKTIVGSGKIAKDSRPVSGFEKVSISGSGHLFIIQGEKESLEIVCDDNIVPHIRTVVEKGILKIGPQGVSLNPSEPIKYNLSLKKLNFLETSGSVLVKGDTLKTKDLKVMISGSGKFDLKKLDAQSILFDISGSGKIDIAAGNANNQIISISGSGDITAPNLKSAETDITVSGSGKANIWVANRLDFDISGSGLLNYYGSPVVSGNVSGSAKIEGLGKK
jgi:Putative auto-transporter adhesin, head GIN domain